MKQFLDGFVGRRTQIFATVGTLLKIGVAFGYMSDDQASVMLDALDKTAEGMLGLAMLFLALKVKRAAA